MEKWRGGEVVEKCRYVVVETGSGGLCIYSSAFSPGLLGLEASVGLSLLGGRVILCRPNPCVISSSTVVRAVKPLRINVLRYRHNYMIEVHRGSVDRLVYPVKVWDSVSGVLKAFALSERPPQQGFVFYGPPGTGKTSLAKLIAEMHGLPIVSINPYGVLSKWLGETEKKLFRKLSEAELLEPSVVLMDDGEWLLLSRELKSRETSASTQLSVMNIVLEMIEKWNEELRKILVLVTTNAPIDILDQALLRSGRLGRQVYIPLPDYEAVYEFLVSEGVEQEAAKRWAIRAVNLGLGMADVKLDILPKLRSGGEPSVVEPRSERGYRRFIVDLSSAPAGVVESFFKALDPSLDFPEVVRRRSMRGSRTVVWFSGPENVALAVANAFITYYAKMPSVTLVDYKYAADAVDAANMLKGFLIIGDSVTEQLPDCAFNTAENVAYAGRKPRDAFKIDVRGSSMHGVDLKTVLKALCYVVLSFYGVESSPSTIDRLVLTGLSRGEEWLLNKLNALGFYGSSPAHLDLVE